ncbi:D-isomer specific 2-hydroxyacid dehydrogenase family protein [Rathayibacter sp. YIM 133350]|uniref:D-isomer specific 2-hydroxyacid dehydrogenase family protein n=1 Tax=Rathayibacter sp. YIM 133350 TaxID=3131992 RepID=UPI00307E318C
MTGAHRAVLPAGADGVPARRPAPGPIAVLPEGEPRFSAAVEQGGGTVGPLGSDTRGVVWLANDRPHDLDAVLAARPGVGWVQLPWAGVDAFSNLIGRHRGVLWTSAKGAFAQPVAEHALGLALALLRYLPQRARAREWDDRPLGVSLYGRRVLIVGAGGICLELIRLLAPFGVHVDVVRQRPDPVPGAERTLSPERLGEVLAEADLVILAAALTPETTSLFGAAEFERMRASAYLVNVGRGRLVDTDALVLALSSGAIAGAALDVTDPEPLPAGHPLWSVPTALITPHMADTPAMTAPLLEERIRVNVAGFVGDGRFLGIVDPDLGY